MKKNYFGMTNNQLVSEGIKFNKAEDGYIEALIKRNVEGTSYTVLLQQMVRCRGIVFRYLFSPTPSFISIICFPSSSLLLLLFFSFLFFFSFPSFSILSFLLFFPSSLFSSYFSLFSFSFLYMCLMLKWLHKLLHLCNHPKSQGGPLTRQTRTRHTIC